MLFSFLEFKNNKFFFSVSRLVLLKFCYCTLNRYYCLLNIVYKPFSGPLCPLTFDLSLPEPLYVTAILYDKVKKYISVLKTTLF